MNRQLALVGVLAEPRADFYIGPVNARRHLFATSLQTALEKAKGETDTDALESELGVASMNAGDYAKAEAHFTTLYESSSYLSPAAGIERARSQSAQGKQTEAAATLDVVKTKWPSFGKLAEEVRTNPESRGNARESGIVDAQRAVSARF